MNDGSVLFPGWSIGAILLSGWCVFAVCCVVYVIACLRVHLAGEREKAEFRRVYDAEMKR